VSDRVEVELRTRDLIEVDLGNENVLVRPGLPCRYLTHRIGDAGTAPADCLIGFGCAANRVARLFRL
jgi:hypothetical protein